MGHSVTVSFFYSLIQSFSQSLIISWDHCVFVFYSINVLLFFVLFCHFVILLFCNSLFPSFCNTHILSFYHLSLCLFVILSFCHPVILSVLFRWPMPSTPVMLWRWKLKKKKPTDQNFPEPQTAAPRLSFNVTNIDDVIHYFVDCNVIDAFHDCYCYDGFDMCEYETMSSCWMIQIVVWYNSISWKEVRIKRIGVIYIYLYECYLSFEAKNYDSYYSFMLILGLFKLCLNHLHHIVFFSHARRLNDEMWKNYVWTE